MSDEIRGPLRAYARATELDPRTARALADAVSTRGPRRLPWTLVPLSVAAAIGLGLWVGRDPPASLPLREVALVMDGQGAVEGTESAPRLRWEEGSVRVTVTPNRGVHLTVDTPEAQIEVIGTAFVVERALEATRVRVEEGTVRLRCGEGATEALGPGAERWCLSADPARLLRRATELYKARAPAAERLTTADAALALAPAGSPLRAELLAHRTRALADGGDSAGALAAAEEALALGPSARRGEMLSFVARTRYASDGCDAVPALERAVAELPPGPEGVLLASCVVGSDPQRAARLLDGADGWATGEWRVTADRLRASLERR